MSSAARRRRRPRHPALRAPAIRYDRRGTAARNDAGRGALRRPEFGFAFRFDRLVPELTRGENVALPLRPAGTSRKAAERTALARGWSAWRWHGVGGKRPGEVSGGRGRRVAVPRALVAGPRVLFADEPTGALDRLNGERVRELLTDAAVVLVTLEARVAACSGREIVVRDGKSRGVERPA
ncbi:ATP-binding cassette domain-containing protein [Streptomyces cinereospinus]|uniref:ATP-binding cassette domain-containing protein n=1 Tax=Streptomyces cinereospinus TaxID=285561 RepID=A0ABV5N1R9_9ACTN